MGLVVAVFEAALEYQSGRTTAIRDLALGSLKGFLAASLFTTVPVELYKLCIDLQGSLSSGIAGASHTEGVSNMARAALGALNGYGVFIAIFLLILMGYSVIKIFFANLKRGGILLITDRGGKPLSVQPSPRLCGRILQLVPPDCGTLPDSVPADHHSDCGTNGLE